MRSDKERVHSLALGWIVFKLLFVLLVLLEGPLEHLAGREREEHVGSEDLGHHSEEQPGHRLPEVIGAANKLEDVAFGDTALRGARLSKIAQDNVAAVVHVLTEHELPEENRVHLVIRDPARRSVVRAQEKVHSKESEDDPVVGAILDDISPRHRVVREAVHEQGLILALQVVDERHSNSDLLHIQQGRIRPVDLFTERKQQQSDRDRTKVLH